jgi:hypothetical protein
MAGAEHRRETGQPRQSLPTPLNANLPPQLATGTRLLGMLLTMDHRHGVDLAAEP